MTHIHKEKRFRKPVSATELMNELNQDPDFVRRQREAERHFKVLGERLKQAEKPLVDALNDVVGISVESIWDLVNTRRSYERAVPVLIAHLNYRYPYRIREGIARALTVKFAGDRAYKALVHQFKSQPDSSDPAQQEFKWALGNAISVVADESHFDEVVELVRDKRHGIARDMMVLRLPTLDSSKSVDVLIEMLDDDQVADNALIALGKLKAEKARARIERLVGHSIPRIREEAGKALLKLDKK